MQTGNNFSSQSVNTKVTLSCYLVSDTDTQGSIKGFPPGWLM